MKGDFSRQTFDQTKHYTAVLMQQGRVQLDADWNEQQAIYEYWAETQAQDVIGPSGTPTQNPGFEIAVDPSSSALSINAGHYYVDGILCENERKTAYDSQPDLPNAPSVVGILQQAGTNLGIVYLDVWQQHVTSLEDRSLRESALGGPDTTTRVKTVWQVKVLPVKEPPSGVVGCAAFFQEWEKLVVPGTGALRARSRPAASVDSPCIIPASAGYRGLENQLYRVEIHKGGVLGDSNNVPTFKWSRDNGTVVTSIDKISGQEITVRDLGPDDVLGFASGQWVEILDDAAELNGQPGQLLQIDQINRASRVITLVTAPVPLSTTSNGVNPNRHPKLRRWDSVKELPVQAPATNEGFISLENGVEVTFGTGSYSTGDHWLIPARTAISSETGAIDWPFTTPQPSRGIRHHYCRLALLRRNPGDDTLSVQDCRKLFRPMTGLGALHVIGINWLNDDVIPVNQLQQDGLQITLDGFAPQAVSPATFVVTLETPLSSSEDPTAVPPCTPAILNGKITVESNSVLWKPEPQDAAVLQKLLEGPPALRILRVTLKGHMIRSVDQGQTFYLDGQAFARPGLRVDDQTARADLILPSGAGVRASDFESWLFVRALVDLPKPELTSFTVAPAVARAGQSVKWAVTLSGAAPSAGETITLTKTVLSGSDPVPDFPPPLSVPAGKTTAALESQTRINVAGTVFIKATLRGVERTAILTTQVVSVTITPPSRTLFPNDKGGIQFSATVKGADDISVTFAIKEKSAGGSIAQTGKTTADYTAPNATGVYHVVATSVADPTEWATATVTVESKEDISDKISKESDKILKESDLPRGVGATFPVTKTAGSASEVPDVQREESASVARGRRATGRAFIRPEERPPVGEPKGAAKKKRGRPSKKKPKP